MLYWTLQEKERPIHVYCMYLSIYVSTHLHLQYVHQLIWPEPGSSEYQSDVLTNWATQALVWASQLRHLSIDTAWFSGWISLRLKLTIFCCNQQKNTYVYGYYIICSNWELSEIQKTQLWVLAGSQFSTAVLVCMWGNKSKARVTYHSTIALVLASSEMSLQ